MWLVNLFSGGLLGKIVDGVSGFFKGRAEARETASLVDAKIRLARVDQAGKVELAGHELQLLRTKGAEGTWKDEYVTLLVSVPILVSVLGSIVSIFLPETGIVIMTSAEQIKDIMTGSTIDYSELWLIVVATSLGTKPFRSAR